MPAYIEPLGELRLIQPMFDKDAVLSHAWGMRIGSVSYIAPALLPDVGASIPRFLWRVIDPPMYTLLFPGSVLHDAAYRGCLRASNGVDDWMPIEKDEADDILYMVGEWNGFPKWKCKAAWEGVHWFGGQAWREGHASEYARNARQMDYSIPGVERACR